MDESVFYASQYRFVISQLANSFMSWIAPALGKGPEASGPTETYAISLRLGPGDLQATIPYH